MIRESMSQERRPISEYGVLRELVDGLLLPSISQVMSPALPKNERQVLLEDCVKVALPFRRVCKLQDNGGQIPLGVRPGLGQETPGDLHDAGLEGRKREEILGRRVFAGHL